MCCHQLFCKNCMTKEWYKTFCLGHVCCHQFFCKNCMTTAWCKSFCWGQMCCHPLFCKNCKAMGCCKAIHIAHMQAGCTHGADMLCAVPRYQIQSCQKDNFRFMGCRRCQLDSFGRSREGCSRGRRRGLWRSSTPFVDRSLHVAQPFFLQLALEFCVLMADVNLVRVAQNGVQLVLRQSFDAIHIIAFQFPVGKRLILATFSGGVNAGSRLHHLLGQKRARPRSEVGCQCLADAEPLLLGRMQRFHFH